MRTLALGLRKSGHGSLVQTPIDRTLGKTSEASLAVGPAVEHQQVHRFRGAIMCPTPWALLSRNLTCCTILQTYLWANYNLICHSCLPIILWNTKSFRELYFFWNIEIKMLKAMQYSDFPDIGLQSHESSQIGCKVPLGAIYRDFIPIYVTPK